MKKFTKLFLSCAAVAALTAAVATSAMAASVTGDVTGTYDEETAKLTVDASENDVTILVVKGKNPTQIAEADIFYIDQVEDGKFGEMGLKSGVTDGTYTVFVGSYVDDEFEVQYGTFTLGDVDGEEVLVGDADDNGKITSADASEILKYTVNKDNKITNVLKSAYVDGNYKLTSNDASCVLKKTVNKEGSMNAGVTMVIPAE